MEVEDCKYPSDAAALARACALRCTQMVAKHKLDLEKGNLLSPVVLRACDYIDRHLYEKFNLEIVSNKLKVSSSHLSKLFKEEKKMTLGEYARLRKIEVAKTLLATTDKSISDIALMLSFNSQSHFGRVFISIQGESPAKYRKNNAIRDNVL